MSVRRSKTLRMAKPRWEHSSGVRYVRQVMTDGVEHIGLEKGRLLLPLRGGLPLLYFITQAYDVVNAIGLEITIGGTEILGIRKVDKDLEHKVLGLLRGERKSKNKATTFEQRLRIVVVIG